MNKVTGFHNDDTSSETYHGEFAEVWEAIGANVKEEWEKANSDLPLRSWINIMLSNDGTPVRLWCVSED